jgi:hypothetical protein
MDKTDGNDSGQDPEHHCRITKGGLQKVSTFMLPGAESRSFLLLSS